MASATNFPASVVPQAPEDPLFGLMRAFRADESKDKVDLVSCPPRPAPATRRVSRPRLVGAFTAGTNSSVRRALELTEMTTRSPGCSPSSRRYVTNSLSICLRQFTPPLSPLCHPHAPCLQILPRNRFIRRAFLPCAAKLRQPLQTPAAFTPPCPAQAHPTPANPNPAPPLRNGHLTKPLPHRPTRSSATTPTSTTSMPRSRASPPTPARPPS